MKMCKPLLFKILLSILFLVSISCGGNGTNSRGNEDGQEAQGTIDGTDRPAANEDSGMASGEGTGAGMASDTVNGDRN